MREWKTASRTLNDFNCEREEDSWLPVARRNCRGGMFVHGADSMGGENCCGNLLWQSSLTLLPPRETPNHVYPNVDAHRLAYSIEL